MNRLRAWFTRSKARNWCIVSAGLTRLAVLHLRLCFCCDSSSVLLSVYSRCMSLRSFNFFAGSTVAPPKPVNGRTTPKQIIRSARGTPSLTPRLTPNGSPKLQSKKGSHLLSMNSDPQQIQIPSSQPTSRSSSPPSHGPAQCKAFEWC